MIRTLEKQPESVPTVEHLKNPEIQAAIIKAVTEQYQPAQLELEGVGEKPDIAAVVAMTTEIAVQGTINIPRIQVVPRGEVKSGFKPFKLMLGALTYSPVSEELWVQMLRTKQLEVISLGKGGYQEARLEDYVVRALMNFDDVSYDNHADMLYDLAAQAVAHLRSYLSEEDTRKVLQCYEKQIADFIHVQMQQHYWEEVAGYDVKVSSGFTELKPSAYSHVAEQPVASYLVSPQDKSNMPKYLFGGFKRCLYSVQKFASDSERVVAVICDRDALRWFKPAKGQFQIFYRQGSEHPEYQPDFVAETGSVIYMLEPKMKKEMDDPVVLAKKEAAVKWCGLASGHARANGAKPWKYVLIPHDAVAENMTLEGLAKHFGSA